jgi:hypothetical protein
MKKFLTAVLVLACAGALSAQAPADKKAPEKKPAAAAPAKPSTAPVAAPAKPEPAKPAPKAARPAEEPEESVVMIDDKAEPAEGGRFAAEAAEPAEPVVPGGLPASYGQCKGVLNDAGRSILVFESPDDGEITFVQLTFGKAGVSWKRLDSIRRTGAEAGFN